MFRYLSEYKPSADSFKYFVFVICTFVPINALLWYISNENGLGRSYINVDYLVPFILSFLIFKFRFASLLFIISFIILYTVDIAKIIMVKFGFEENIFNAAGNFGGIKLAGIVSSLYTGNIISEFRQTPNIQCYIFFGGLIISLIIALNQFRKKRPVIKFLAIISFLYVIFTLIFLSDSVFLLSLEIFIFLILFSLAARNNIRSLISRSDLLVFVLVLTCFIFMGLKSNRPQDEQRNFFSNITTFVLFNFKVEKKDIDSATKEIFELINSNKVKQYDNVFLIIVESLGTLKDESAMKKIMSVFEDPELLKDYKIEHNNLPFEGHTTTAELRELCRWQMVGLPNITNKGEFGTCLPELMKAQGYHTIGIHNSSRFVLDRNEWWPLLNLDEIHFLQDMTEKYNYKNFCDGGKGYTAICEEDVLGKVIPDFMSKDKKNFVYFLTVQSHTPIDEKDPITPGFQKICDETEVLKGSKTACRIYDIQNNVFESTISLAKRLKNQSNIFILVGDHTPPFFKNNLASKFRQDVIPMIIIKSKKVK